MKSRSSKLGSNQVHVGCAVSSERYAHPLSSQSGTKSNAGPEPGLEIRYRIFRNHPRALRYFLPYGVWVIVLMNSPSLAWKRIGLLQALVAEDSKIIVLNHRLSLLTRSSLLSGTECSVRGRRIAMSRSSVGAHRTSRIRPLKSLLLPSTPCEQICVAQDSTHSLATPDTDHLVGLHCP